jgi:hypothetical protein
MDEKDSGAHWFRRGAYFGAGVLVILFCLYFSSYS